MTDYRGISWKELLSRMAAQPRDEDAWTEAHRRLQLHARYALPREKAGNAELACDVSSRVLIKLHQAREILLRLGQSDHGFDCKRYLITMLCHAAADVARSEARHTRHTSPLIFPDQVPGSDSAAAEYAEAKERLQILETAIRDHFGAEDARLLRLRYWEDWSLREMAAELGISYHALAMRMFRLQKKLREVIDPSQ